MAWLAAMLPEELAIRPSDPDWATLTYWIERFTPLTEQAKTRVPWMWCLPTAAAWKRAPVLLGSSAVLRIDGTGVRLFDMLGKGEERCLVVDTDQVSTVHCAAAKLTVSEGASIESIGVLSSARCVFRRGMDIRTG